MIGPTHLQLDAWRLMAYDFKYFCLHSAIKQKQMSWPIIKKAKINNFQKKFSTHFQKQVILAL